MRECDRIRGLHLIYEIIDYYYESEYYIVL